jgi:aconitate hydratase
MTELIDKGIWLFKGREPVIDTGENGGLLDRKLSETPGQAVPDREGARSLARRGTISHRILAAHHRGKDAIGPGSPLALSFDAMASHDITFVNIIQTAKLSGLEAFPVPYYLTNCHNSLCAVGGTINEDDHVFGLSAAKRYGGVFVPPHLAVIHSFVREAAAGCGKMILGSDSHTRYGCLGTMGVGEGGGELVKQLLKQSYQIAYPRVILVYLEGRPRPGVGPQDVALELVGAVFGSGFVKNAALEFAGPGIASLPLDFRAGIDVMSTETTCWSTVWETDEQVRDFLGIHGRPEDYRPLGPESVAYYDGLIRIDLSAVKPMVALPFHPSKVFTIDEVLANGEDIFARVEKDAAEILEEPSGKNRVSFRLRDKILGKGRIRVDQGIVAGCAGGTFDNIMAVSAILSRRNRQGGGGRAAGAFSLSVYPGSQPVMLELTRNGAVAELIAAGAVIRTAFCGPCFGAGDVPANNGLSIRHSTRNFPNREGSKPSNGQIASVALMDARSIAATALNGGFLASAEGLADFEEPRISYRYDPEIYESRVYSAAGKPDRKAELVYGPNITDWPDMEALGENLLVKIVSFITDPVTTTDELIPSGETSSFRSNPVGLAEFTLSRKDPGYVGRAKAVQRAAAVLREGGLVFASGEDGGLPEFTRILESLSRIEGGEQGKFQFGSAIFARKPGDGSAREQAASCQRVLGGAANFAGDYATKRYRSNLINWGILPFNIGGEPPFKNGDYVFIPGIRKAVASAAPETEAWVISAGDGNAAAFRLKVPELESSELEILLAGSLINYNRDKARL